jgi:hypothetical protein
VSAGGVEPGRLERPGRVGLRPILARVSSGGLLCAFVERGTRTSLVYPARWMMLRAASAARRPHFWMCLWSTHSDFGCV